MTQNKATLWVWDGKECDIRNLDQRQLYSIKQTLANSNRNWFGHSKEEWNKSIEPLLKQHEHMNIRHIAHQRNQRLTVSANGIADKVIQMFTKNDKHAVNSNSRREV